MLACLSFLRGVFTQRVFLLLLFLLLSAVLVQFASDFAKKSGGRRSGKRNRNLHNFSRVFPCGLQNSFFETAPKRIRKKRRGEIGLHGEGTVTPFVDWGCRIRPFSPPHATQTRKHLFGILILKFFQIFSSKQQFVLTLRFLHGDAQPSRETIKKSHTKPQIGAPPSPVVTRPPGPPPSYSSTLLYESLIFSTAGVFLPLPFPSLEREAAFAIFFYSQAAEANN